MVSRSLVTSITLTLLAATSTAAKGQVAPEWKPGWELVVPAGRLIPTGAQRDAIERGGMNAVQLSYVARPTLALTSTLGWARSRDVAAPNHPKVDVLLLDVGAEARAPRWLAHGSWSLGPFAGLGAGVRSYNHRAQDSMTHGVAAFGGAGAELGYRRVRLRVEARDYVSGRDGLRNDVVTMFGLRIASRS